MPLPHPSELHQSVSRGPQGALAPPVSTGGGSNSCTDNYLEPNWADECVRLHSTTQKNSITPPDPHSSTTVRPE